jgi:hypothetical protein
MALEILARLTKKFATETVGSNNSQKRTFVVNTEGEYPNDIAFILWKDKCSEIDKINMGELVTVKFRLSSREYQGKYFTDAIAYSVAVKKYDNVGKNANEPVQNTEELITPDTGIKNDNSDDLPF